MDIRPVHSSATDGLSEEFRFSRRKPPIDNSYSCKIAGFICRCTNPLSGASPAFADGLYKSKSMWAFDDPEVGFTPEPFVSGADAIIERMVQETLKSFAEFSMPHSPLKSSL
jgi:hypothetical protein